MTGMSQIIGNRDKKNNRKISVKLKTIFLHLSIIVIIKLEKQEKFLEVHGL